MIQRPFNRAGKIKKSLKLVFPKLEDSKKLVRYGHLFQQQQWKCKGQKKSIGVIEATNVNKSGAKSGTSFQGRGRKFQAKKHPQLNFFSNFKRLR